MEVVVLGFLQFQHLTLRLTTVTVRMEGDKAFLFTTLRRVGVGAVVIRPRILQTALLVVAHRGIMQRVVGVGTREAHLVHDMKESLLLHAIRRHLLGLPIIIDPFRG